jgi:hypothetical protein
MSCAAMAMLIAMRTPAISAASNGA